MTKSITVYFENDEFELLKRSKRKLNWHDFIMTLTEIQENEQQNGIHVQTFDFKQNIKQQIEQKQEDNSID